MKFDKPEKHSRKWTAEEDAVLRTMAPGETILAIAKVVQRTAASVEARARALGVKASYALRKSRD